VVHLVAALDTMIPNRGEQFRAATEYHATGNYGLAQSRRKPSDDDLGQPEMGFRGHNRT
jgi:hypothetical protein